MQKNVDRISDQQGNMKIKHSFALSFVLLLSACGSDLPKTISLNGANIEIVGEANVPNGDLLLVRPMRCPWNHSAWATFRVHGGEPENICLIFENNDVREAFEHGGSLPTDHEDFKWASNWGPNGPSK